MGTAMITATHEPQRRAPTERKRPLQQSALSWPSHVPPNVWRRIDALTDQSAGPSAHWRWLGSRMQANGYPQISYRDAETGKRVTRNVHRVLMEIRAGRRLERAEVVLHDKGCQQDDVNPAHLRIGTHRENLQEAAAKCGKRLAAEQVQLIDKMLRRGVSAGAIAARFGVTPKCVVNILRGKTHGALTGRERTRGKGGRPHKRVLIAPSVAGLPQHTEAPLQ